MPTCVNNATENAFEKALLHARTLTLKSKLQWELWRKSGTFPQPHARSTSTTGGKAMGTGWAPAT